MRRRRRCSTRPARALLYETGIGPRVYAPLEDYDHELLTPTDTTSHCPFKGDASYWTVTVGDDERVDALWAYRDPMPEASWLAGLAALYPSKVDTWVVEDDRCSPTCAIRFTASTSMPARARSWCGSAAARSPARGTRRSLFETGLPVRAYMSRLDIEPGAVAPGSGKRTVCPYKGQADYWTVAGVTDAAWSYEAPLPEAVRAQGLLSFRARGRGCGGGDRRLSDCPGIRRRRAIEACVAAEWRSSHRGARQPA